jgi:hypothetical protein
MEIQVSIEQVDVVQPAVDREFVLDGPGDVSPEEDPLAWQEEAAVRGVLVTLRPGAGLDLRLESTWSWYSSSSVSSRKPGPKSAISGERPDWTLPDRGSAAPGAGGISDPSR